MIRKPRLCRPAGTEPPAFNGSREAPTTAIVVADSRISRPLRLTAGLGRLPAVLRRCQGELEHVLHAAGEVEGHGQPHALGYIVEVFLVPLRKDDLLQP